MTETKYHVFTDGACKGNPGKGGWGWVEYEDDNGKPSYHSGICFTDCGGEDKTTNNRMEMMAVIKYFEDSPHGRNIFLYSDSQYVLKSLVYGGNGTLGNSQNIYSGWMKKWKSNHYADVKNVDLWKRLDKIITKQIENHTKISLQYVEGHKGIIGNEKADELANKGIDSR